MGGRVRAGYKRSDDDERWGLYDEFGDFAWTTPNPATAEQVTHTELNLTAGQPYYFAVRAQNEGGLWRKVGASDGVLADPNFVPLTAPKLKKPGKGEIVTNPKVKLNWDNVVGATFYNVIVKRGGKKGETVFEKKRNRSAAKTRVLTSGEKYVWRAQACTEYGCGKWSKWWGFTVQ